MKYRTYLQGASPAAWKATGRGLGYAQNVSDGSVKDGGKTWCQEFDTYIGIFMESQSSKNTILQA